jgi:hypothetical protein
VQIKFVPPRWARAYLELLALLVETTGLRVDPDAVARSIVAESELEITA